MARCPNCGTRLSRQLIIGVGSVGWGGNKWGNWYKPGWGGNWGWPGWNWNKFGWGYPGGGKPWHWVHGWRSNEYEYDDNQYFFSQAADLIGLAALSFAGKGFLFCS